MPNKSLTNQQRYKQRLRYYSKHREGAERRRQRVTQQELILIKQHLIPDAELSKTIKRSVEAIQIIRTKIKNGVYKLHN